MLQVRYYQSYDLNENKMSEATHVSAAEKDVELFKTIFQGNEPLAKLVKNLFLGLELTTAEKAQIKVAFKNPDLREAMRRKVYGELADEAPLGSVGDAWLNVQENQIVGAHENTIKQLMLSKQRVIDMFKQGLSLLENPDAPKVELDFNPRLVSNDPFAITFLARNLYIKAMIFAVYAAHQAANQVTETTEEVAKKKIKNSAK